MFKRPKRQMTEAQTANRTVNKLLTYGLIAFLLYILFSHSKQAEPPHFSFTKQNYTSITLPPLLQVKNLDTDESKTYIVDDNGLILNGNNVVKIVP